MSEEQVSQQAGSEGSSQTSSAPAVSATEALRANAANLFGGSKNASQAASKPETPRSESQSINPKFQKNQDSNNSESDQLPNSEETNNATNLETDKQAQGKQFQSKGDKRFQQMANELREVKALLAQKQIVEGGTGKEPKEAKSDTPSIVPKPNKPTYSKEQLDQAEAIARQRGDESLMKSVLEEREKLRQYELDERFWKLENDKAVNKYQETVNHHITEAVKKWPDLTKNDSPHFQLFEKLSQRVPEILSRSQGDGHYLLAEVAHTYLKNQELESKLAALEAKSKQTETENSGLKKRIAPAVQNKSLPVGVNPAGKKMNAGDELRQRMQALEEAGQLGR